MSGLVSTVGSWGVIRKCSNAESSTHGLFSGTKELLILLFRRSALLAVSGENVSSTEKKHELALRCRISDSAFQFPKNRFSIFGVSDGA